jgi:5-methylcytosine-specific restriction enzyme A
LAKLNTLKPLVASMKPRIATMRETRDKAVNRNTAAWRQWYKSARWQRLRMEVFVRDNFTCQRSGVIASGKSPEPNSPVANHIKPHHGDPDLFWDINNIETVTKAVHDSVIQSEEKRSGM